MCYYFFTLFYLTLYQDCVWYGVCNRTKVHNQYCSYSGPAKRMPEDGVKLLQKQCGFMLENGQKDFCCDAEQVVNSIENKKETLYSQPFIPLQMSG